MKSYKMSRGRNTSNKVGYHCTTGTLSCTCI